MDEAQPRTVVASSMPQEHTLSGDSLTVNDATTPILQGHVFKQSSHGIGSKFGLISFKKIYFVLFDGVLMYYRHQSSYEKDKHHSMTHGKKILLDDLHLTHCSLHTTSHCFTLHTPHTHNKRKLYLLAMTDRKSRNIWMEMLQQQNQQLEPSISETDGHPKPLPPYINMIRSLSTPSPIMKQRPHTPDQIHITELENVHYSAMHETIPAMTQLRRGTWSCHQPSGLLKTTGKEYKKSLSEGAVPSYNSRSGRQTSSNSLNSDHELQKSSV